MSLSNSTRSNITTGCEGLRNPSQGPPPFRKNEKPNDQSYFAIVNKYNYSSILSQCCQTSNLGYYSCDGPSNLMCCVYCNVTQPGLTADAAASCARRQISPQENDVWGSIQWDAKGGAEKMRLGWWAWSVVGLAVMGVAGGL
ncbi:hypothetical protein B0J11DRAFT_506706 [Dendryphion nanum]|uniref:Uncharacterized protein n=1 Tax=Dendryphion nanum TaxID=256645 RepID=A0A9P9DRD5_9PLEO|nr:hypothetical protein B0J11DRAFT_506706 [Dendryphion nanum]